jgi:L-alanine-DL-glutamate epimerase-like enolase superfamily enzyme
VRRLHRNEEDRGDGGVQLQGGGSHNPLSPLSTVIAVHFGASIPNFLILETHNQNIGGRRVCNDLITEVLTPKDGYFPSRQARLGRGPQLRLP